LVEPPKVKPKVNCPPLGAPFLVSNEFILVAKVSSEQAQTVHQPTMPDSRTDDKYDRKERHSADPKSSVKGEPKKDGAGGAGTWGKVGDESGPAALDKGDPNYDSEAEDAKPKKFTKKQLAKRKLMVGGGI